MNAFKRRGFEEILTNARALKKLTSNRVRHSSGVLSAIRFTGERVPWLTIRLSSLQNRCIVVSTAWDPIYVF
jgi:hypothetical protein